jgi:hypothetical protein
VGIQFCMARQSRIFHNVQRQKIVKYRNLHYFCSKNLN